MRDLAVVVKEKGWGSLKVPEMKIKTPADWWIPVVHDIDLLKYAQYVFNTTKANRCSNNGFGYYGFFFVDGKENVVNVSSLNKRVKKLVQEMAIEYHNSKLHDLPLSKLYAETKGYEDSDEDSDEPPALVKNLPSNPTWFQNTQTAKKQIIPPSLANYVPPPPPAPTLRKSSIEIALRIFFSDIMNTTKTMSITMERGGQFTSLIAFIESRFEKDKIPRLADDEGRWKLTLLTNGGNFTSKDIELLSTPGTNTFLNVLSQFSVKSTS
jgi:hypothetical protein